MRRSAGLLCMAFAFTTHRVLAAQSIPSELANLPLVVLPVEPARQDLFAVLLTGDGGWAELPRDVSDGLRAAGIPVVGLNSRRYFRHRRTPEETAHDVQRIVAYYALEWSAARVLLIGYSRGADVLPFVINRLTPDVRARVALAALLNPATETRFVVGVDDSGDDPPHPGSLPLLPEVSTLDGVALLCLYGLSDRHALCPTLEPDRYDLLAVGHGHHFDHEYTALVDAILARLPRTDVPAP
jgi:type IV secretory pathway VirJ component